MSTHIWLFKDENTLLSQIIEPNQKSLITDLDGSIKFVKKKEGLQDSYDFELELHTYHPKKDSENSELLRCCQTRVTMSILSTSLIETEMLQRVFGTSSISTNKSGGFNKITKDLHLESYHTEFEPNEKQHISIKLQFSAPDDNKKLIKENVYFDQISDEDQTRV